MALVHDATPEHQDASSSALAEGALLLVFVGLPRSGKPWRPFPRDTTVPGQSGILDSDSAHGTRSCGPMDCTDQQSARPEIAYAVPFDDQA